MQLSIVIPLYNEEESLFPLLSALSAVMEKEPLSYEIIFVDDGSTDGSLQTLRELEAGNPSVVRYLSFGRNHGKSAALRVGIEAAAGDVIVTMDADLQDDPFAIPRLLEVLNEGWDVVSGWKKNRKDPVLSKNIPSKIFNRVVSKMAGISLHDFNCGFKAYRARAAKSLDIYGERHRFLPLLAYWNGYSVTEVEVPHHARKYGVSKFGMERFVNGFFDLATLLFLRNYMSSPLHFFGLLSLALIAVGGGILSYFGFQWLLGAGLYIRPLILFAVTSIIVGVQFFSIGLLGELIINSRKDKAFPIKESSKPQRGESL